MGLLVVARRPNLAGGAYVPVAPRGSHADLVGPHLGGRHRGVASRDPRGRRAKQPRVRRSHELRSRDAARIQHAPRGLTSGPVDRVGTAACRSARVRRAHLAGLPAPAEVRLGPCRQPSSTQIWPPSISSTRPLMSQSSEASHATTGELLAGSIASKASAPPLTRAIISGNAPSVIRVRATGAIALTLTP